MPRYQQAGRAPITVESLRGRCPAHDTMTTWAVLSLVVQRARTRAVPYPAYIAAHGILGGLTMQQYSPAVDAWLETLTPDQVLALVAEVANACATLAEVIPYLTARGIGIETGTGTSALVGTEGTCV